ncbi:hypothetical protein OSB04_021163, partial [Centaurea solstitialis]
MEFVLGFHLIWVRPMLATSVCSFIHPDKVDASKCFNLTLLFTCFCRGFERIAQAKNRHSNEQGRWPAKSAKFICELLKNAESNTEVKGLDVDALHISQTPTSSGHEIDMLCNHRSPPPSSLLYSLCFGYAPATSALTLVVTAPTTSTAGALVQTQRQPTPPLFVQVKTEDDLLPIPERPCVPQLTPPPPHPLFGLCESDSFHIGSHVLQGHPVGEEPKIVFPFWRMTIVMNIEK